MSDPDLVELAMRAVQQPGIEAVAREPVASEPGANLVEIIESKKAAGVGEKPGPASVPANAALTRPAPAKEKKAADELAAMIFDDLSNIEGCPTRGVRVTVYGSNPWNSWLSFGAEAGPVPNKADLQGFCEIITERLMRLYDVS